ncbi:MAG: hypothetical protein IKZ88_08550 [Neisseriaceae bacterium]|nr:hypothetical protein [Neisseriaceae bacterium]
MSSGYVLPCGRTDFFNNALIDCSGCLKPYSSLRAVPHARRGNLLKQFLNERSEFKKCFRVAYPKKRTQYKMI